MDDIIQFKETLAKAHIRGLALDIDETLSWTLGHWVAELQERFGNPENLSVKELIAKYRYTANMPQYQSKEALEWKEWARNDNDLHEILPLIEHANTIVSKINEIIPIVAYITARPDTVIAGTQTWLDKHHFPKARIVTRPPNVDLPDANKWKAQLLEKLYPEVTGIVDDNPELSKHFSPNYKGTIYMYNNATSTRTDINVIACMTWDDVLAQVIKNSSSPLK